MLNKLKPDLLTNYDEIIKTYEKKNILEKVETTVKSGLVHCVLHHAVIKYERETTKIRIVF